MYGLHYYGIARNALGKLEKEAKILNVNNFLLGNSTYKGNYVKMELLGSNDVVMMFLWKST